jgi:hypothetical protein
MRPGPAGGFRWDGDTPAQDMHTRDMSKTRSRCPEMLVVNAHESQATDEALAQQRQVIVPKDQTVCRHQQRHALARGRTVQILVSKVLVQLLMLLLLLLFLGLWEQWR